MSYVKGLAATAALAFIGVLATPAAHAEAGTPAFAVQSIAGSHMRLGYNAYQAGDYEKAARFTTKGTVKGIKKSRRAIAYSNLCAALGQQGVLDAAREACASALEMAPNNWRAMNNRGVVNYLAGDKVAASTDFTTAAKTPDASVAKANADLLAGTKMAASE